MQTAVCQRNAMGERVCGDDVAVVGEGEQWLLAVIDGLGHGPEAHEAARTARATIERHPDLSLEALVAQMGRELRALRGACIGLAQVDLARWQLRCVIVGNVEISGVSRDPIRPLPSPGIVGRDIRKLRLYETGLAPGDRLFLFSDGISRRVELARYRAVAIQQAADGVVRDFGEKHDDATCLVADLPHVSP